MNHPGEIAYLTRLARPTVALVNNAQRAHLGGLGSLTEVARAKGEIFEGLDCARRGRDQCRRSAGRAVALAGRPRPQIGFGFAAAAEVRGQWQAARLWRCR